MLESRIEGEAALRESRTHYRRLAYYNVISGLPNRVSYNEFLKKKLAESYAGGAVIYIDSDNLKFVNDTYGHQYGDLVFKEIAERFGMPAHPAQSVFHIGGDEFVIVLETITNLSKLEEYAQSLVALFEEPFAIADNQVYVPLSWMPRPIRLSPRLSIPL
jgi:diguanylate cyclase (GGDEF)-like protein